MPGECYSFLFPLSLHSQSGITLLTSVKSSLRGGGWKRAINRQKQSVGAEVRANFCQIHKTVMAEGGKNVFFIFLKDILLLNLQQFIFLMFPQVKARFCNLLGRNIFTFCFAR